MTLSRFNQFKKKTNINVVSLRGVIGDMGRFSKGLTIENTTPILEIPHEKDKKYTSRRSFKGRILKTAKD